MKRQTLVSLVVAFLLLAVCVPLASTAPRRTPKLVVILVVDQMRADYVEKFGQNWTSGLRRLMNEGAWFRQAAYPYMTLVTCVGHSTVVTGSLPSTHGIVANAWWDREKGATAGCVADVDQSLISYGVPAKGGRARRTCWSRRSPTSCGSRWASPRASSRRR